MADTYVESSWKKQNPTFDKQLRPQKLTDFIGQTSLKDKLDVYIGAAKKRAEPLGHCLFHGPPGLGKTTLSNIIANEMGTNLVITSGPSIEKPADLAGILTNLQTGDLLFIDEIHRLSTNIEEYLYSAMEDFRLDLTLDSGPQARSVQVTLSPFTLIGATTKIGLLSNPMRSRFGFTCRLNYYPADILQNILNRSSSILDIPINMDCLHEISKRSRGTPRIANNLLKWVRDYAQMRTHNKLDPLITRTALEMLDIDHRGLNEMDKKFLKTIIDHHEGGPVGISTLAAALGEEIVTLAEVNEPFLIMNGFLKRTLRGREATKLAYEHLGCVPEKKSTKEEG